MLDALWRLIIAPDEINNKFVGYKKGSDEWRQSQTTSEDDSSTQSSHDDEASIGDVKKGRARFVGSHHCLGRPTSGLSGASFSSPQNQEEIDSLRRQVQELSKEHNADRIRFHRLENLVRSLINMHQYDQYDSDGEN
ncbi:hypothetical protein HAX54_048821 [Datura stramonium]|uniref:Uncharacterized protein n=1 Tax=Datura stramonium TaxID=4076 RepID=A0ABS8SUV0_DATST|nr:hypothetical protein [Datura stramonium]